MGFEVQKEHLRKDFDKCQIFMSARLSLLGKFLICQVGGGSVKHDI